jgi:uncharacterized membrane protein
MNGSRLHTALLVNGIYAVVVGILLLFPAWAAAVFAYPTKDPAADSGWGASIIGIGLVVLGAASDTAKYGGLAWAFVVGLLLIALDLVYFWATGIYTARNVLLPILINIALAAWIWSARPKE